MESVDLKMVLCHEEQEVDAGIYGKVAVEQEAYADEAYKSHRREKRRVFVQFEICMICTYSGDF